jgi:CDP-diacylglycerol--serine O-phosphatidyltransferase
MVEFAVGERFLGAYEHAVAGYVIIVALLMVSTLPTISLKALRVPREWFIPALLIIGIIIAGLFARTWLVLIIISVSYLASLPFTYMAYRKRMAQKGRI